MKYTYDYPMQSVCADAIVVHNDEILLIKRNTEPFKDQYALPGGHLDLTDKNTQEAAERELKEETGIDLSKCEVLKFTEVGTFSEINRDPRGRYISVVYSYELMYKPRLVLDPKEVKSALWMDISDIYRGVLAFDHYEILLKFLRSF
jgi:8-oxo-dGTP diphosphatase